MINNDTTIYCYITLRHFPFAVITLYSKALFINNDRPHLLHDLLVSCLRHDEPASQARNTIQSMRLDMQIARLQVARSLFASIFLSCILHQDRLEGHQRWTTFLGWLFQGPCVPAVYPHCKWLWQYQPLTVRASPGWHLACPCSSELLLPDPQSSDLPLGSSCAKHVYTCGEEGLTHICHQRCFEPSPLDIAGYQF